ncbi:GerAB/ArcD/ProY family transporter [Ammoniphilus sp. YIM 78166]|uniref:GerAB/ArcD/ProY family transporter n=1 Tax=Ammoniphilus sp. YIM 78166 TaxID=1644106 RepID=UPI00106F4EC0|nr:GerAB/ArcD/ProY family transporter [Ammoniphilus sp. YIM 78166]
MEKAKISSSQLFILIFLFELGSAIVVGLGLQAKQDAWLAILLGMLGGLVLFLIYIYLFYQFPNLPLTSYIPKVLGKYVGYPLALLYILYFIYIASRVLRDFTDLLLTFAYPETPMFMIHLIMIALIIYAVCKGIETIARTGEILVVVIITYGVLGISFLFLSDAVRSENLLPILENGWKPVLTTAFPLTLTFPFGEMVVFAMLLPYLNQPKRGMKIGLSAMTLSGLVLTVTVAIDIAVLGTYFATTSTFPLLHAAQKINVGGFIQRLDPIVISTLIIGGFFKIAVFFYAAAAGVADLFKVRKRDPMIFSIGIVILIASIQIAGNLPEHLEIGLEKVPIYLHLPFQVGIPLLLLIVTGIRKRYHHI